MNMKISYYLDSVEAVASFDYLESILCPGEISLAHVLYLVRNSQ
jgi:hypothetical protein